MKTFTCVNENMLNSRQVATHVGQKGKHQNGLWVLRLELHHPDWQNRSDS